MAVPAPMNPIADSQAYATVAATYQLGADRPWGASLVASARVLLVDGGFGPELGPVIRVDASGADGVHASFGAVVGVASVMRADVRYLPYWQLDVGGGLQVGKGGPGVQVDVGLAKALNPYLWQPQSSTSIGLDGFSVRVDGAYTIRWGQPVDPDAGLPAFDRSGGPIRLGLGAQICALPLLYSL